MKRFASLIAAAGAVAAVSAFALAGGASGAGSLPTVNIALTGTTGISMPSTSVPSGAVQLVVTHTGKNGGNGPSFGIVRLNPNVPASTAIAQGFGAIGASHGNLDALTATGNALIVSANAPGTVQTVLTPGNYIALNEGASGKPPFVQFTVSASSSPAALPAAKATQTAIEFGFKGPRVLTNGTIVRAQNKGYLVHMIVLIGVKSKAAGLKELGLLRAGASGKKERRYENGHFVSLLNPASPGALQQSKLHTKPGFYVEACFMNTQDGREHTRLGMERLVRVVK